MTQLQRMNDHMIALPADMTVRHETGYPGAHDYIVYKGAEIFTYESHGEAPEVYTGPFFVLIDGEHEHHAVADIQLVRELIDDHQVEDSA